MSGFASDTLNGSKENPFSVTFHGGILAPFSRLKVANPKTLFDSKQIHDNQPLLWDTQTTGTGSSVYDNTNAKTVLSVTTTGDKAIRQTKQRFNYQPGKGQVIIITGKFNSGAEKTRIGYFDGNNGVFLEIDNSVVSWNIMKNGVVTETATQDQWNIDNLNGYGTSRKTLDFTKQNIAIIQMEWLGVGSVGVGFDLDGMIIPCHAFNHASAFDEVYTQTPNLPVRYEIESNGGAGSLYSNCCSVQSEGSFDDISVSRSLFNFEKTISVTGIALQPICIMRIKSGYKGATINPISINTISTSNDNYGWAILMNPTYGTSVTYHSLPNSAIEYQNLKTATPITTLHQIGSGNEGIVLDSGYASSTNRSTNEDLNNALRLGFDLADVGDTMCLAIQTFSNTTITGSITLRELL